MMNMKIFSYFLLVSLLSLVSAGARDNTVATKKVGRVASIGFTKFISPSPITNKQAPFTVPKSFVLQKQLQVRGGAGPLDPDLMNKICMASLLLHGVHSFAAPETVSAAYGVDKTSDFRTYQLETMSTSVLAFGVLSYCLIVEGTSLTKALGISEIPAAILMIRGYLKGTATNLGMSVGAWNFFTVLILASVYGGLSGAGWTSNLYKAKSAFYIAFGLFGMIAPQSCLKSQGWQNADIADDMQQQCNSMVLLNVSMAVYMLLEGKKNIGEVLAYANVVSLLEHIKWRFITKEYLAMGTNVIPIYVSMLLSAAHAYTLLV